MGRIHIDTEALHDLSGQLGNDAREWVVSNLDLVRAWSHALPPPASLVSIGAESGRIQARLGVQTSGLAFDATRLGFYASGVEVQEGGRRLFGDLAAWSGQIRSEARSAWKQFRAWGSHVIPTVARGLVQASFGALGQLTPFKGAVDMLSKVVVATGVGVVSLAWTTLLNDPAELAPVQPPPRTVQAPEDLVAIGGTLGGDQIAIVKLADDRYVVVLRGVMLDKTSLYCNKEVAAIEEVADWGPYSDAVMRAIEANVPKGASVSFVGHSEGGIVAVNVSDRLAQHGYAPGPNLTLGAPTVGEAYTRTNLVAVVNDPYGPTRDPVTNLDADGLRFRVQPLPPNVIVVHQPGGLVPHNMSFYEDAIRDLPDPLPDALQKYKDQMRFQAGQQATVRVYNLGP